MIGSIRHPRDRQRFRIERARDQSKDTNDAAIQAIEYALYRCLARSGDAEEWFAVESICPHSGGPLYQGDIEDGPVIICPYHEYRFDLRTGRCIDVSCEGDDNGEEQLMINRLSVVRYEDDRLDLSLQDGWRLVLDNDELDTQQIVEQFAADIIKLNVFDSVRSPSTLMEMAWRILQTADPAEKVRQTLQAAHAWQERSIKRGKLRGDHGLHVWLKSMEPPPRTADIKVVPANKAIRLGNAGSLQSRIAILHSLANIEQWAIDLAWDIIVRFASQPTEISSEDNGKLFLLPDEFLEDFVQVAADEAKVCRIPSIDCI
jgi:nitrite reductase/ring-hydroxylating ferredoxin subunit